MSSIKYVNNKSTLSDVITHLNTCDKQFKPKLSETVEIKTYAAKIVENAFTAEAWCDGRLIGLIACYINNFKKRVAFITNVSVVLDFAGQGVAKQLLKNTITAVINENYNKIVLEVESDNLVAIALYKKFGFYLDSRNGSKNKMTKRLEEKDNIVVSICTVTYNHEKYIHNAIEGFLMQKTTFPLEILIHDDASTDKTADIIRKYEEKYPDIIKPIYQTENQYQKGQTISPVYQWPRAKGKYIAPCEGDDYWTDPYKLQKQFDFLEANEDYSACFHNAEVLRENGEKTLFHKTPIKDTYNFNEIITGWFVPTASLLFRNKPILHETMSDFAKYKIVSGDRLLLALLGDLGKIKYMPESMSVYRKHEGGISSWGNRVKIFSSNVKLFKALKKQFRNKYNSALNAQIFRWYGLLALEQLKAKQYFKYLMHLFLALGYVRNINDFKAWLKLYLLRKK
jgi:glycosyltransferase involved in cell wall biosynthesis/GNAT superfamily N-acetyltransferase